MDSSILQSPQIIFPSMGTISPLFTIKVSPIFISSKFISIIFSSSNFFAVIFLISAKSFSAVVVCFTDRCSKTFPSKTNDIIVADVSKNK